MIEGAGTEEKDEEIEVESDDEEESAKENHFIVND